MKIFVSRRVPLDSLRPLSESGWTVDMYEHDSRCTRDELLFRARDADALLVQGTDEIDWNLIASSPRLKVVSCCSLGYDNIDLKAAALFGVTICNSPEPELVATTAEAAIALLLSVAKRITRLHAYRQTSELPPYSFIKPMGLPVRNQVTGIIGLGRIGSAIAKIMRRGFGNSIVYFNRSAKVELEQSLGAQRRSMDDLMCESDFVFVVVPLSSDTRNLVSSHKLAKLKSSAIFVNIARAGIVDDSALLQLLAEDRIYGAGLDVYEETTSGYELPNLVLTAHRANGETQAIMATLRLAVRNVVAVLNGQPPVSTVNV